MSERTFWCDLTVRFDGPKKMTKRERGRESEARTDREWTRKEVEDRHQIDLPPSSWGGYVNVILRIYISSKTHSIYILPISVTKVFYYHCWFRIRNPTFGQCFRTHIVPLVYYLSTLLQYQQSFEWHSRYSCSGWFQLSWFWSIIKVNQKNIQILIHNRKFGTTTLGLN